MSIWTLSTMRKTGILTFTTSNTRPATTQQQQLGQLPMKPIRTESLKLGVCLTCKTPRRINTTTRKWYSKPTGNGVASDRMSLINTRTREKINGFDYPLSSNARELLVCCGRKISFKAIKAKITNHICSAKCLTATTHICSCSCGGKNHGINYQ